MKRPPTTLPRPRLANQATSPTDSRVLSRRPGCRRESRSRRFDQQPLRPPDIRAWVPEILHMSCDMLVLVEEAAVGGQGAAHVAGRADGVAHFMQRVENCDQCGNAWASTMADAPCPQPIQRRSRLRCACRRRRRARVASSQRGWLGRRAEESLSASQARNPTCAVVFSVSGIARRGLPSPAPGGLTRPPSPRIAVLGDLPHNPTSLPPKPSDPRRGQVHGHGPCRPARLRPKARTAVLRLRLRERRD